MGEEVSYNLKIVMVGDTNVGKTKMIDRFIKQRFIGDSKPTIGVEFTTKKIFLEKIPVFIQIWDTAGQEKYHAIISAYYRGASGAILVYDTTNRDSYLNAKEHWLDNITRACNKDIPIILVGSKIDLENERVVKYEEGEVSAMEHVLQFSECSSKTGKSVEKFFNDFIYHIFQVEKNSNFKNTKKEVRREDLKEKQLRLVDTTEEDNDRICC